MLMSSPWLPCPGLALLGGGVNLLELSKAPLCCTELGSAGIAGNRGREIEDLLLGKSSHFLPSGDICDNHGERYHSSLQ